MSENVFLKNMMEDLVWLLMKDVLAKWPEACNCEVCRHDMAAIALNSLRPRYVVRTKGEVLSRTSELESQHRADVYSAITRAVLLVSEKPRH
ncbi:MAG: late competence development ComFB family protein [Syntrophomonadaceae bacterium]|jgi:competence protein ComFB|nr:late competence development ComFB family protein [Syntrophomonadaceae bacterium]